MQVKIIVYCLILALLSVITSMPAAALEDIEYISQISGNEEYYVRSPAHPTGNNFVGQTFITPSNCKYIKYIELHIDANQWSTSENITLTLYTSTAKTTKVSEATLTGSSVTNYPQFYLKTSIKPNTAYYMELSHDQGGDNEIGGIVATISDSYSNGFAYQGNTTLNQLSGDLYFRIWGNLGDIFWITAFYIPSPELTTAAQYDLLKAANFNHVLITQKDSYLNESFNNSILDLCETRGITVQNHEIDFSEPRTDAEIDAFVDRYKNHPANAGFYIRDEPPTSKLLNCAYAYNRMLDRAPTKAPHVNLLSMMGGETNLEVSPKKVIEQENTGADCSIGKNHYSLGQTFIPNCTYIEYIELKLDSATWDSTESLVLTLYESIDRIKVVSKARLNGSANNDYPRFYLDTSVTPDMSYYMELSHEGGGDELVYRVAYSSLDSYIYGLGYARLNDALYGLSGDLYFKVYSAYSSKTQSISQTIIDNGVRLNTSRLIGQTFTTSFNLERRLQFIELNIDSEDWDGNEHLTMTLYDSPSKNITIESVTIQHPDILNFKQDKKGAFTTITDNYVLGQTFTTPADCTYIDSIVMAMETGDKYWSSDESLTLTLYDSPAKANKISAAQVTASENKVSCSPKFYICSNVNAMTQYYMELSYDGSNGHIPWVNMSTSDVYSGGDAYENGVVNQNSDFYFEIYNKLSTSTPLYPRFYFGAALKPNTQYYFELAYKDKDINENIGLPANNNNQIGLVHKSTLNTYDGGTTYVNGIADPGDLYFRTVYKHFYQDYINEWIDAVGASNLQYLSFDHYPFRDTGNFITSQYYISLELMREMALRHNVTMATYLQATGDPSFGMLMPSQEQLKYNVFTSLAYGVKMVQWYCYFTPTTTINTSLDSCIKRDGTVHNAIYYPVQALNAIMINWGPVLMKLASMAVYHTKIETYTSGVRILPNDFWCQPREADSNLIISYFTNQNGRKYVMIVNKNLIDIVTYSFNFSPSTTGVKEVLKSTGLEVNANYSNGYLTNSFFPGEGRLYAMPIGY